MELKIKMNERETERVERILAKFDRMNKYDKKQALTIVQQLAEDSQNLALVQRFNLLFDELDAPRVEILKELARGLEQRESTLEQSDEYKEWIAELDMKGPAANLRWLEDHIQNAPESLKNHPDYQYFKGFLDGRILHEELGGI